MGLLDRLFGKKVSLAEVVELTSVSAFVNSHAQVRALVDKRQYPSVLGADDEALNDAGWDLVLELLAFTLHVADRIAFDELGPDGRERFFDALLQSVSSSLSTSLLKDASPQDQAAFRKRFLALYDERTDFYVTLRFPESGEPSLGGTLFWEAGKQCAGRILPGEPSAGVLLSIMFGQSVHALKDLRSQLETVAGR